MLYRGAVRYLTERAKGRVLMPDEINEKSGDTVVAEVITSKHPEARTPDASSLDKYNTTLISLTLPTFRKKPLRKLHAASLVAQV